LPPESETATKRAAQLLEQLLPVTEEEAQIVRPDPLEMAATALRTMKFPELAPFIESLVPEVPLWAAHPPRFLSGRADAVAMEGDRIALVVDWKSDVNPDAAAQGRHAAQLRDYLAVVGGVRGAVVYMSSGYVAWIEPAAR
jgi:exodeoxyribonuclease-5/CRISPR-associated exonuclease Cas4